MIKTTHLITAFSVQKLLDRRCQYTGSVVVKVKYITRYRVHS